MTAPDSQRARAWLGRRFFTTDAESLARRLLGCLLVRTLPDGQRLSGLVVETEAYLGTADTASHTLGGRRTPRNESMWGRPGLAYVYFTYGMHHCVNISAGRAGDPVAVLIRALEPVEGLAAMRDRRQGHRPRRRPLTDRDLCAGPGRLCQALAIDRDLDGFDLAGPMVEGLGGLHVERRKTSRLSDEHIATGPRIGLSGDDEWTRRPLRFAVAGSAFVSRPRL